MATSRVSFVTNLGQRADLIRSRAPADLEVTLVGILLPEEEKITLCR